MMNELIVAIEAMDPAILEGAFLATTTIFAMIAVSALIRYLMKAIGYAKMYRKAGEAPWKAFIPVYSTYNNYKISWNTKRFFLYAALYILFYALCNSTMMSLQLAGLAAGITAIVMDVMQNLKMAKCFGKGAGTGIALMFFPGITSLILGLGKAEIQADMTENN